MRTARIVEAVKRTGRRMMAENYCYFHYIRQWKQIIDQASRPDLHAEAEYVHEIENLITPRPVTTGATMATDLVRAHCRPLHACGRPHRRQRPRGLPQTPRRRASGALDREVGLFRTDSDAVIKTFAAVAPRYPHWFITRSTAHAVTSRTGDGSDTDAIYGSKARPPTMNADSAGPR